jgi:uroporphyrinogen-III synthase
MKITVTSELTIYNDLVKLCNNKSIAIEKKIALSIEKLSFKNKIYTNPMTHVQNIIFQSKNAVRYSVDIHKDIANNTKAKIYCLGKYTKSELNKLFENEIIHPYENYSSEALIDLISKETEYNSTYIVIKGEGGRSYISDQLLKLGKVVDQLNVYRRNEINAFISEKDLSDKESNYILISSKTALNAFIKFTNNLATYKKMILITPNARLTEDIQNNPFNDVMIIANNSSANTYIEKIQEHNDKE